MSDKAENGNSAPKANAAPPAPPNRDAMIAMAMGVDVATVERGKSMSMFSMFKYQPGCDKAQLIIACIISILAGLGMPMVAVAFGMVHDGFDKDEGEDNADVYAEVNKICIMFCYIGASLLVLWTLLYALWMPLGEKCASTYRLKYYEALLAQNITWYDNEKPQELPVSLSTKCDLIREGTGEKFGNLLSTVCMTFAGLIVSLYFGWHLCLIMIVFSPMLILSVKKVITVSQNSMKDSMILNKQAGGIVEETLASIKTVLSFGAENYEIEKYLGVIETVKTRANKSNKVKAMAFAFLKFTFLAIYAVGFFFGGIMMKEDVYLHTLGRDYSIGSIIACLVGYIFAFFSVGNCLPQLAAVFQGKIAAVALFGLIDKTAEDKKTIIAANKIDPSMKATNIRFNNVSFQYPTRCTEPTFTNLNLEFEEKKMTGICGSSGSGKSSIVQLIERFYEPSSGEVSMDGENITSFDLTKYRQMIGYVGQEPVLFNTSILKNIRYGKPTATIEEVQEAARKANCYNFIMKFDKGFDTVVGTGGSQVSGGQKQRIAIARAIVKNPSILIMDEATSALDLKAEKKIQEAIAKISRGITTIVIAHRIATIRGADKIIVMEEGKVVEEGSHVQLVKNTEGKYIELIHNQEVGYDQNIIDVPEGSDLASLGSTVLSQEVLDTTPMLAKNPRKKSDSEKQVGADEIQIAVAEEELKKKKAPKPGFGRIMKENKEKKGTMVAALISSIGVGAVFPLFGLTWSMCIQALMINDDEEMFEEVWKRTIYLMLTGVLNGGASYILFIAFGKLSTHVTCKLRGALFTHLLQLPPVYFDQPENAPSKLNGVLSDDTAKVNAVLENQIGTMLQCTFALIIAVTIACFYSWRMALITVCLMPLFGASGYFTHKVIFHLASIKLQKIHEKSLQLVSESVQNIRTVASFANEGFLLNMFNDLLLAPRKNIQKEGFLVGLMYGIGEGGKTCVFGLTFFLAGLMVNEYDEDPGNVLIALYVIMFGSFALGNSKQFAGDATKAQVSIAKIYKIEDTVPSIQGGDAEIDASSILIEFRDVYFKYREEEEWVLKGFSAVFNSPARIAIVGMSGSGKSSLLQLLLRFYEINKGEILINHQSIRNYQLSSLRKTFSYVIQEPTLFDRSFKENIEYNTKNVGKEELVKSLKCACADEFLIERYKGMDEALAANAGFKTFLSGGQKQRLAIARAILRGSKIMMMDEATSALDKVTEEAVTKGIEESWKEDKIWIIVAHRLSTVQQMNTIYVLDNGQVAEHGTYEELLNNENGPFYNLYHGWAAAEIQGADGADGPTHQKLL